MTPMAEDQRLPADLDAQPLVQAAAALRSTIHGYRDEIEREQRLPKALVQEFHAAGFYKMVMPRALGGLQVDPLTYVRVVEVLSHSSGSLGWNVANTSYRRETRLAECRRDLHVVAQAVTLLPEWYPMGGRALLGMDPGPRLR